MSKLNSRRKDPSSSSPRHFFSFKPPSTETLRPAGRDCLHVCLSRVLRQRRLGAAAITAAAPLYYIYRRAAVEAKHSSVARVESKLLSPATIQGHGLLLRIDGRFSVVNSCRSIICENKVLGKRSIS